MSYRQEKTFSHTLLDLPHDLSSDYQRRDARSFRQRCRMDVLRVMDDLLAKVSGSPKIMAKDILQSSLLTRIYKPQDIDAALDYWQQKGFCEVLTLDVLCQVDQNRDVDIHAAITSYNWEESTLPPGGSSRPRHELLYDVFICHASEDKVSFVDELAHALAREKLVVWYDAFSLQLGDT